MASAMALLGGDKLQGIQTRICSGREAETVGMMKLSCKRTEERLGKRSTGSPRVRVHARRGRGRTGAAGFHR
jgi:hypothetical protein